MRDDATIAVIIPALNEEASLGRVLEAVPEWVDDVIVADNGSHDGTVEVARGHGARVVVSPRRGYGSACQAGMAELGCADVVVFLDADFSDDPSQMGRLVDPIIAGEADIVIGSRALGRAEPGALTPQQRWGNWLATRLIGLFWGVRFTDLGPFRAVRYRTLWELAMRDPNFGWTVEMQIKAARDRLRAIETPVPYRKRIGKSKISGTVRGVALAGCKILWTIFRAALANRRKRRSGRRSVVFTKYPIPGHSKTRLIPALGPEGAALLHREMSERTVEWLRGFGRERACEVEARITGAGRRDARRWLGKGLAIRPQGWGDLGRRLSRAFQEAFAEGCARVVIIGTDCPRLASETLEKAFDALESSDLVIGPAFDGGYYLIGLRRPAPFLFQDIEWGSETVFDETMKRARRRGLEATVLEELDDLDRPEDLALWETVTGREPVYSSDLTISVVIPTLNEAEHIEATLASAREQGVVERIVVDGGSRDDTRRIAERHGAKVLRADGGRARQMNAGAEAAWGSILLFLHADTRLPSRFARHVRWALLGSGVTAGAFEFAIDGPRRRFGLVEALTNWRSRRLQMPYGDQGLFVRTEVFRRAGGYPDQPIMDDYELARRLRKMGRIVIAPAAARTSPRRWLRLGVVQTALINQAVLIGYHLGLAPERLAHWYRRRPR